MDTKIYHVTEKHYFDNQMENGKYFSPTFNIEQFIHLSTEKQVNDTLQKYYLGKKSLILLHINVALIENLKYELANNGQYFPHIYGPILTEYIIKIEHLDIPTLGIEIWKK